MTESPYPPFHFKLPAAAARARVHDGLIVTMARISGLCWQENHRRSPAYTMAELVELLGRPQATLYRHLKELGQLGWIRVHRDGKHYVLYLLIPVSVQTGAALEGQDQDGRPGPPPETETKTDLGQALREAGIVGQPLNELLHHNVSPASVRAWYWWTLLEGQGQIRNPAGYIITRLRAGVQPPEEFRQLAALTSEEMAQLRTARINSEQYQGWPSLDEGLRAIAPLWSSVHDQLSQEQRSAAWAGSAAGP
jgi:DNA-binding transcriptional ArsR family regulator